jgi:4-hydroxybenzoate polyprenyltransferase
LKAPAAVKIVADVLAYRLRKLEMANLAGGISISVSLHLPWTDVAARALFAVGLNVLVYLNNDYIDVDIDLASADKDNEKTRFLAEHRGAALFAQLAVAGLLGATAWAYEPGLFVPLVAGGGICWVYSAYLKRLPFLDLLAIMIWGLTMPLSGVPLSSALGWGMAVQLGLFAGVFEAIQVIRDANEDAVVEGVRTTGVVLGQRRTLALARGLMLLCCLYTAAVMHPLAALVLAGAFLVPFTPERIERYWTRVKLVYGAAWLFVCAWVYFHGKSAGLLWILEAGGGG